MPWNDTARDQHTRDHLRYPGDLTDRAWALIAPMLPAATRALEGREASPTAGVTDTIGLMPVLIIQSAGVQDRDGAA